MLNSEVYFCALSQKSKVYHVGDLRFREYPAEVKHARMPGLKFPAVRWYYTSGNIWLLLRPWGVDWYHVDGMLEAPIFVVPRSAWCAKKGKILCACLAGNRRSNINRVGQKHFTLATGAERDVLRLNELLNEGTVE